MPKLLLTINTINMKNWVAYLLGIFTGGVFVLFGAMCAGSASSSIDDEKKQIVMFDTPGECVSKRHFQVEKVLKSGDAIAREVDEFIGGFASTTELEVLVLDKGENHFYDKQILKIPEGKCARQIGTYRYGYGSLKKVIPVVAFE